MKDSYEIIEALMKIERCARECFDTDWKNEAKLQELRVALDELDDARSAALMREQLTNGQ